MRITGAGDMAGSKLDVWNVVESHIIIKRRPWGDSGVSCSGMDHKLVTPDLGEFFGYIKAQKMVE